MTCPTCGGLGVIVPDDDDPAHAGCDHLGGDCRCLAGAPECEDCGGLGSLPDPEQAEGGAA